MLFIHMLKGGVDMLTEREYKQMQARFSYKLKNDGTKISHAYNEGVLACKSILSELYSHNNKEEKEND